MLDGKTIGIFVVIGIVLQGIAYATGYTLEIGLFMFVATFLFGGWLAVQQQKKTVNPTHQANASQPENSVKPQSAASSQPPKKVIME